jgi:1-phosphofructokinase family hexose kinase
MSSIVVACPNLSLDRTIAVVRVSAGGVHRAGRVDVRGGGKGVNVVRALRSLGIHAPVLGLCAGRTGGAVLALLEDEGLEAEGVPARGETRSCLAIVSAGEVTVFNEPGPRIDAAIWAQLEGRIVERLGRATCFICSGSFPPGAPDDAAGRLVHAATRLGCTTICDTSAGQLDAALRATPDLVAPNLAEAEQLVHGRAEESLAEGSDALARAHDAAEALVARGPRAVLVTAGAAGAVLAHEGRTHTLEAFEVNVCNPVGAGDCLVAGIAAGLARGDDLVASARYGMALAAAGCETFAAGVIDRVRVERLLATS